MQKVPHECTTCFRIKLRCQQQQVAELSPERVNSDPPFNDVGVDSCGPLLVTYAQRRSSSGKCFVVIFVGMVTRAVHVELVADLTTAVILAALQRFTAHRGRPIMSNNANNFVGFI